LAIDSNPREPTLWCNRAYARLEVGNFGIALNDCSEYDYLLDRSHAYSHHLGQPKPLNWIRRMRKRIIGLYPLFDLIEYFLRYDVYRRAQCYIQVLEPRRAIGDLRRVVALEPNNEKVKSQLLSTQKLVRKLDFAKVSELPGCTFQNIHLPLKGH
jgi:serine/threonine-protein phosphatase 5